MSVTHSVFFRRFALVTLGCLIGVLVPAVDAFAIHSVDSVSPPAIGQGATGQDLVVHGSNFLPGATASFSPATGITINSQTRNDSSTITVNVTIAGTATVGARDVTVTNPLEGGATCTGCLTINAGPKLTSASPNALGQGATSKVVTVAGTGFVDGLSVAISGTGITIGAMVVSSSTSVSMGLTVASGATTGARDITFTNPDKGKGTCAACLTIDLGPTVSGVSPSAGSNTGSSLLTITGTHFVSGVAVGLTKTGQSTITSTVQSFSSTSLTVSVNLNLAAPGAWDVVVVNPDFGRATCAACFTVAGATPTVTSATPDTLGQGASSVDVALAGTNFAHGVDVTVSGTGVTVDAVAVNSGTSITATISVSASAAKTTRDITVTNTDGQHGTCSCLTIATGPTAPVVAPTSRGQGASNQDFTITGTGFVTGAQVSFSGTGVSVGTVTVGGGGTTITTTISLTGAAPVGTRDVIVTNPDHGSATCPACFTVHAAPVATSLDPAALGQGAASQDIAVTGTGFVSGVTVAFSGTKVTINGSVTFNSATSLTVNVTVASDAAPGARNVTVTNPDEGTSTCTSCFTVDASPAITSASPNHLGQGASSQTVTLTGTGFTAGSDIAAAGTGVTVDDVTFADSTHLHVTFSVSGSAATGNRTLTVSNPDLGQGSCAACFSITAAPVATSASPSALGQGATNQTVTLHGGGFVSGVSVAVSGTGVTVGTITVTDPTLMTVVLSVSSAAPTGTRDITLTNTDHGTATCSACLTIDDGPTISAEGVSPSAGSNSGSNQLTITGTHFDPAATVTLKKTGQPDIAGDPVEFVSSTSLKATVDLTLVAPGAWDVVVANPDHGTFTCAGCFTVAASTPAVTSASPDTLGQGASGLSVDITGTNFAHGAQVTISGTGITVGTPVTVVSATHITVPLSATSTAPTTARDITVTNTDGQHGTCTGCITVDAPPNVTSITPAQRGAGLTDQDLAFAGSGFTSGTTVAFSGTGITVNLVTFHNAGSLTVNVDIDPGAATTARNVTLANPDGGARTCTGCFTVTGPTTVTFTTPTTLSGSVIVTFSHTVSGVSSSNVLLKLTGTSTVVSTTLTCKNAAAVTVSCSTGPVKTATLTPVAPLTSGQKYTAFVAPGGSPAITDAGGLQVAADSAAFRASTSEQENSPGVVYTWRLRASSTAYGGSYAVDHLQGASAAFKFTGTTVAWYTITGPNYGVAYVYIDGISYGAFNLYASSTHPGVTRSFSGLTNAPHTISIVVRGLKGSSAGTGTDVAVDAFSVNGNKINTPALTYTWQRLSSAFTSGGAFAQSDYGDALAVFTFRGTRVDWYTTTGPAMGKAYVYIDGTLFNTVDNYSSTTLYGATRSYLGMSDAVHTIKIRVVGAHNAASSGNMIVIDRFVVT